MGTRRMVRVIAVSILMCGPARLDAGQIDVLARARGLALAGQRGEAVELLEAYLAGSPMDSAARVLLGTVLSWEGRYDAARRALDIVLNENPTHGDALRASINVELWSQHPARAEELASRGLHGHPAEPDYLLARARALVALQRSAEARETLDRLLAIDPHHADGDALRRSVRAGLRRWQARVGTSYDAFSDRRAAWREWQVSVGRATSVGLFLLTGRRADRVELDDDQFEVEMYPRLGAGTYAHVAGAYSAKAVLYPEYRYAADLHQVLGAGFEASAGFRRLGFGRGVNIYAGSLSKYYGNWLFTGRLFVTPDRAGVSESVHASIRRYFGGHGTYVGVRYGRGGREELRNRNDFDVLDSDVGGVDWVVVHDGGLELKVSGSYGREDRAGQRRLRQYALSTGLGFRF